MLCHSQSMLQSNPGKAQRFLVARKRLRTPVERPQFACAIVHAEALFESTFNALSKPSTAAGNNPLSTGETAKLSGALHVAPESTYSYRPPRYEPKTPHIEQRALVAVSAKFGANCAQRVPIRCKPQASASYSAIFPATSSGNPAARRTLDATRPVKLRPRHVKTGKPSIARRWLSNERCKEACPETDRPPVTCEMIFDGCTLGAKISRFGSTPRAAASLCNFAWPSPQPGPAREHYPAPD